MFYGKDLQNTDRSVIWLNIHVGKYVITSDSLNIILNERKVVKDGKRKGKNILSLLATMAP